MYSEGLGYFEVWRDWAFNACVRGTMFNTCQTCTLTWLYYCTTGSNTRVILMLLSAFTNNPISILTMICSYVYFMWLMCWSCTFMMNDFIGEMNKRYEEPYQIYHLNNWWPFSFLDIPIPQWIWHHSQLVCLISTYWKIEQGKVSC